MLKDVLISLLLFAAFLTGAILGGAFIWAGVREGGKIYQKMIDGYFAEMYVNNKHNSEKKE